MKHQDDPLNLAIAGETAIGLGLSARKLRAALDALRAYDARTQIDPDARDALVEDAAEACWGYIVQREIIGLGMYDAEYIRWQYEVPDEVWYRLGPKTRPRMIANG
jgi:hypothetical protein